MRKDRSTKEHHIASPRDVTVNRVLWVVMLCSFVASVTVIVMQQGVINRLVQQIGEPSTPPAVIRLNTPGSGDLVCVIQPGSTNNAPRYTCTKE